MSVNASMPVFLLPEAQHNIEWHSGELYVAAVVHALFFEVLYRRQLRHVPKMRAYVVKDRRSFDESYILI